MPTMSAEPDAVGYERRGAAAVITIDRQHRRNAVDGLTAAALHEAYLRFEQDDDARVLVLAGAGGVSFCAGADLKATDTMVERLMSAEGPMGFTRLTPSKPTIAAISGFCLAGGLEIALWCDLRIATEDSRLGYPERRWGVPLIDGGTVRLPRLIGAGRAMDLILTGRPVDAAEAHRIGLVDRVVGHGQALPAARALGLELAALPQTCLRHDRLSLLEQEGLDEAAALANELAHGRISLRQAQAGVERFQAGAGRHGASA
jgi:enoyl-CoA hydratase